MQNRIKIPKGTRIAMSLACGVLCALAGQLGGQRVGSQLQAAPELQAGGDTAARSNADVIAASPGGGAGGRGGRGGRGGGVGLVFKATITPHWFQNSTRFWYMNALRGGTKEFILVDAEKGSRQPAFDHQKLATGLSKAAGQEFTADKLPFSAIDFVNDGAIQFTVSSNTWKCDLTSYECAVTTSTPQNASLNQATQEPDSTVLPAQESEQVANSDEAASEPNDELMLPPQQQAQGLAAGGGFGAGGRGAGGRGGGGGRGRGLFNQLPVISPDNKWTAFVTNYNVFVRAAEGGEDIQLSQDGVTNNSYGLINWARDSKGLVAWRIEPDNVGDVYRIQSTPQGTGARTVLQTVRYSQAGDIFTRYELSVFDVAARRQIKPDVERTDYGSPNVRWNVDGYHFTYEKEDRGHQRFRIIEVDTHTGALRNIIDEKTQTFIWTMNTDAFTNMTHVSYLRSGEILYESEQSGWRHLYLVNVKSGEMTPITKGEWVVRGLESDGIDEEKRQIWFRASGIYPDQDPYFVHYGHVNFDGTGLVFMTAGNGHHSVNYSPDYKYIIDTYSHLDTPPVNELRRVSDGKLICPLEEADISELKATGWKPLEPFVAKGRDGKTDIYGYIERPRDFDPNRKYPVVEDIYAGPQGTPSTMVPKSFMTFGAHAAYTSNGFIVVKIDGMGMPNRSKAFHDVCWHNLADAGFPDRIAWMKAAAEKYPYMDLSRVGIYGTSAGGQNAAAAVLFHPEFYKVAVANCGCHDNRIDKSSWNEQWMGYMPPDTIWTNTPDNWYSKCSNINNAGRLQGKLFLIVGELDSNVPPESTFRFVDALIKARKDFDMLVVPGANHGAGSPITGRRTVDYFVHNLLHQEPPNRNLETAETP